MPTEFKHITIPSQDLNKSIAFYNALGMQLVELEENHHAHFENKQHNVIFTAYLVPTLPEYDVKVYFEIDHLEEYEARFRESVLSKTTLKNWGGKEVHLKDPDGNHLVLYQKFKATNLPPWQKPTHES